MIGNPAVAFTVQDYHGIERNITYLIRNYSDFSSKNSEIEQPPPVWHTDEGLGQNNLPVALPLQYTTYGGIRK